MHFLKIVPGDSRTNFDNYVIEVIDEPILPEGLALCNEVTYVEAAAAKAHGVCACL